MAFLHYLKRLSGFQKGTFMELVIWLVGLFHRSVSELKDNTRRTHKLSRPPYRAFILQTLRKERIIKWTVHISGGSLSHIGAMQTSQKLRILFPL
jgi:hypothetical protein